jgi:hypothetical protein
LIITDKFVVFIESSHQAMTKDRIETADITKDDNQEPHYIQAVFPKGCKNSSLLIYYFNSNSLAKSLYLDLLQ